MAFSFPRSDLDPSDFLSSSIKTIKYELIKFGDRLKKQCSPLQSIVINTLLPDFIQMNFSVIIVCEEWSILGGCFRAVKCYGQGVHTKGGQDYRRQHFVIVRLTRHWMTFKHHRRTNVDHSVDRKSHLTAFNVLKTSFFG